MEQSLRALIIGFCLSLLLAIFKFLVATFTWQFVLLPFLIVLAFNLILVLIVLIGDAVSDIKHEMEDKRR